MVNPQTCFLLLLSSRNMVHSCREIVCLLLGCLLRFSKCPTLCDPTDCSPRGSSVHGILQAGILEWVAVFFSRGSSQPRDWTCISCIAGKFFTDWAHTYTHSTDKMLLVSKGEKDLGRNTPQRKHGLSQKARDQDLSFILREMGSHWQVWRVY